MVTPYLESLIHRGIATIRTYSGALSAEMGFRIPPNNYAVILQMIVYPCSPQYGIVDAPIDVMDFDAVNQIFIRSDKLSQTFHVRSQCVINSDPLLGKFPSYTPVLIPMYMVVANEVKIAYASLGKNATLAADTYSPLDPISNEEPQPVASGYVAAGYRVVRSMNLLGAVGAYSYCPQSIERSGFAPGFARDIYEFKIPQNELQNVSAQMFAASFPLIHITYCLINETKPNIH